MQSYKTCHIHQSRCPEQYFRNESQSVLSAHGRIHGTAQWNFSKALCRNTNSIIKAYLSPIVYIFSSIKQYDIHTHNFILTIFLLLCLQICNFSMFYFCTFLPFSVCVWTIAGIVIIKQAAWVTPKEDEKCALAVVLFHWFHFSLRKLVVQLLGVSGSENKQVESFHKFKTKKIYTVFEFLTNYFA